MFIEDQMISHGPINSSRYLGNLYKSASGNYKLHDEFKFPCPSFEQLRTSYYNDLLFRGFSKEWAYNRVYGV